MPSTPKPKQFVAVSNFKHGRHVYKVGDPVVDRREIAHLIRYGDRFIKPKRNQTPAVDTATTDTPESTEED